MINRIVEIIKIGQEIIIGVNIIVNAIKKWITPKTMHTTNRIIPNRTTKGTETKWKKTKKNTKDHGKTITQIGEERAMSNSVQAIIMHITTIITHIATIMAAIMLIKVKKTNGISPAIDEIQKTKMVISPTIHNGQKMNANGKKIIVRTV